MMQCMLQTPRNNTARTEDFTYAAMFVNNSAPVVRGGKNLPLQSAPLLVEIL